MNRRSFLAAVGVAGVASGCLSEDQRGGQSTTIPLSAVATDPVQPPVVDGAVELDPGTLWIKPALRYTDGETRRSYEAANGVWGYAEVALRNVGSEPVAKPSVTDFRLVSGGRIVAPVQTLSEIDWGSLRQREPRFGRSGYADPASDEIEPGESAYCGLLFDFAFSASPALFWTRDGGVTVAFARIERSSDRSREVF